MLKVKTKTHKFRRIADDLRSDVKAPLVEALETFYKKPMMQFHIPGHTAGRAAYRPFKKLIGSRALLLDTTDEFDNLGTLHPATGPIKEAQELAAQAFDAKRTFFLLGGSTLGNLTLAMCMSKKGKKVIVNRNCHRSILTGMIISGAEPVWILPEKLNEWSLWGEIEPAEIEKALKENNDVSMVWITNPTYEGVVSNIKAIADICKKYDVPLIVDEAHGCLWNFNRNLPESSLHLGADAVVHSLHKTGGSMSQSSMLHIPEGSKFDPDEIERTLQLLQTTSPSMLLMASLDAARANLESKHGKKQLNRAIQYAKFVRKRLHNIEGVHVLEATENFNQDITKIFVKVDGLSGKRLESILEIDFDIEVESASDIGVLLLINIGNTKQEIQDIYHLLKGQQEYFWNAQKNLVKNELAEKTVPAYRISSALRVICDYNLVQSHDDIKKLFDSDNEILICEAAAALKNLNKLDGVDKVKLLDKIHDDNKKALIQSMFAG